MGNIDKQPLRMQGSSQGHGRLGSEGRGSGFFGVALACRPTRATLIGVFRETPCGPSS